MKENEKSKRNYVQKTRKSLVYFCAVANSTQAKAFSNVLFFTRAYTNSFIVIAVNLRATQSYGIPADWTISSKSFWVRI